MILETVGARCAVAGLAGAIAGIVASLFMMWPAAILLGWDGASICYLAWTWKIIGRLDAESTRQHADIEDASRRTAEGIVLASGVALSGCRRLGPGQGRRNLTAARRPISSRSGS